MIKLCPQRPITYGVIGGYYQWDIKVFGTWYQPVTRIWLYKAVKFILR